MTVALRNTLFEQCYQRTTGTFFVTTQDNRSAQILVEEGIIKGANYAELTSYEALTTLMSQSDLPFSFSQDLAFPIRQPLSDTETNAFLEEFGYMEFLNRQKAVEKELAEMADAAKQITEEANNTRYYRGQAVKGSEPKAKQEAPTEVSAKPKSSPRIYRGQVIRD